jgi:two-component system response regulator NreC
VVLVDAHELMRRSLALLLDAEEGIEVIAEAADLEGVEMDHEGPNVLVADFRMLDGSRPQAIRRLHEQVPDLGIVVLTMHEVPTLARQALEAGALGFVRKQFADGELAQAVRAAASGEVYVSPPIAARLRLNP